jgi:hypothetical protein
VTSSNRSARVRRPSRTICSRPAHRRPVDGLGWFRKAAVRVAPGRCLEPRRAPRFSRERIIGEVLDLLVDTCQHKPTLPRRTRPRTGAPTDGTAPPGSVSHCGFLELDLRDATRDKCHESTTPHGRAARRDLDIGRLWAASSYLSPRRRRRCTVTLDTECVPAPCWTLPPASAPSRERCSSPW